MQPLRLLLPLLAALAGLLASAATAPAAEPGLNMAGGAGTPAEFDQLTDVGAKWARHSISWDTIGESALADFGKGFAEEDRRGIKTLLMVHSGSTTPPADPQAYANFVGSIAARYRGSLEAIEIWNEEDEGMFWQGGPQADRYVDLLKRSYTTIKAANPEMTVVFGPLTGGNAAFLQQAYDRGAKGYFDVLAAHTDTSCLVDPPSKYYREDDGRIARFTFLGYRTLRQTMEANGDPKPIWLTEIGWSAARHVCERGMWAGQKLAGVTEADQAKNLLEAFHCLAEDPYVQVAMWYNSRDPVADGREESSYGLLRADGTRRPVYSAFQQYARFGDRLTGVCGDFMAPRVQITSPSPDFTIGTGEALPIRVTSPDGDVTRVTLAVKGAPSEIRNFTNKGLVFDVRGGVGLEWMGAKRLPVGAHTLVATAKDVSGNVGRAEVRFVKVDPRSLRSAATTTRGLKLLGKGRNRTLVGQVRSTLRFKLGGKVLVEWQNKRKGSWKKIHGAAYNASKPFRFAQRLKYKGAWRVRVKYVGVRPFRSSTSRWLTFRVK